MKEREQYDWKARTNPKRNISEIDKEHLKRIQFKATEFDTQYRAELAQEEARKQYVPRCPTCGCPDVERIGAGEKIADTVVWGFLARKPRCQFRCKACGHEW